MPTSRPSIAELRAVVHPPGLLDRRSAEHWAGRLYMRDISLYATWLLAPTRVTANAITGIMIVVGLVGAAFFSQPGLGWAVAGALLIQVYLMLDCTDGEIARWKSQQSITGVYLDRLGHYLVEASLMIGLGARAAATDGQTWLIWGFCAAFGVLIEKAETDLVDVARARAGHRAASDDSSVIRAKGLARARQIAMKIPLHRATHAVEASLLILAAAIADAAMDSTVATRGLLVALTVITAATSVLHLVSILSSRRLEP